MWHVFPNSHSVLGYGQYSAGISFKKCKYLAVLQYNVLQYNFKLASVHVKLYVYLFFSVY